MSPLNLIPSGSFLAQPPKSKHAMVFFMSEWPKIDGAMLDEIFS
jgi:hypothetical protein